MTHTLWKQMGFVVVVVVVFVCLVLFRFFFFWFFFGGVCSQALQKPDQTGAGYKIELILQKGFQVRSHLI